MTTPPSEPIVSESISLSIKKRRPWIIITAIAVAVAILIGIFTFMQYVQIQEFRSAISRLESSSRIEPMTDVSVATAPDYLSYEGWDFVTSDPILGNKPMAQDNIVARFEGSTRVDGEAIYSFNELSGTEEICMHVFGIGFNNDPPIPNVKGNKNSERIFCFSNVDLAIKAFGPKHGRTWAVVEIDGYQLASAAAEVRDTTTFVAVPAKEMTVTESELSSDFPVFCPPAGSGPSETVSGTRQLIEYGCSDANWRTSSTLVRDEAGETDVVTWTFGSHQFTWRVAGGEKHVVTVIGDRAWDSYEEYGGEDQPVTVTDLALDGTELHAVAKSFVYPDGALGPFQGARFDVNDDYTGGVLTMSSTTYDVTFTPPSIVRHID